MPNTIGLTVSVAVGEGVGAISLVTFCSVFNVLSSGSDYEPEVRGRSSCTSILYVQLMLGIAALRLSRANLFAKVGIFRQNAKAISG